jgi:hypothetical protein
LVSSATIGLPDRLLNALRTTGFYLAKTVWPVDLSPYYPMEIAKASARDLVAAAFFVATSAAGVLAFARGRRFWLVLWLIYLVMLAPVIGIVQVGGQAAADRYTYLPTIGLFLLVGSGLLEGVRRFSPEKWQTHSRFRPPAVALLLPVMGIVAVLGVLTHAQVAVWRTSETLWTSVIQVFPGKVAQAHNNLGTFYHQRRRLGEAAEQYQQAIGVYPRHAGAHNNLGLVYQEVRRLDEAEREFIASLAIDPRMANAHANLAMNFFLKGDLARARHHRAAAEALGAKIARRLQHSLDASP